MRHGVKINHLGRKTPHRKALMRNMAIALIEHKRITTTLAKAKALRVFVEPLLTKAKKDDMNNRRVVFSYLQNKEAIKELFDIISSKIADRPGGYTRIIKLERRLGDAADMALIELVDFNEIYNTTTTVGEEKKKTRRGRVKKAGTTPVAAAPEVATPVAEETVATPEAESTTDVVAEATPETPVADTNASTEESAEPQA
ncbi:MAG: 50S ribosomal protein L17 [Bacteroidetes bacterium]|nr:50S ribosomal protein L17 [Bacteroidota bacterium]MBP6315771.1 50S ribosomal protein L17 [Chitinophagaceae bacterium]